MPGNLDGNDERAVDADVVVVVVAADIAAANDIDVAVFAVRLSLLVLLMSMYALYSR
jgi:hypothetical protein